METVIDGVTRVGASLLNGYKSGIEACEPALGSPASSGHVLSSTDAGVRSWVAPYASPTSTEGDLIVRGAAADGRLGVGSEGDVLTVASGVPAWQPPVAVANPAVCCARLTLTSGVPVTTTDVTGASTVYLTPYRGNLVALYSGSAWAYHTLTEISLELSGLTAGKNYDVFCYDNSGTLTLALSSAWTDDTTRQQALAYQDGIRVLASDHTRRLMGTIRATGATTTDDSGSPAANPKRLVLNEQNRVPRSIVCTESTSHVYTTQTWRAWNNSATVRIEALFDGESAALFNYLCSSSADSAANARKITIAVDSTSDKHASASEIAIQGLGSGYFTYQHSCLNVALSEGYHYIVPLEWALASGTATWSGMQMEAILWM